MREYKRVFVFQESLNKTNVQQAELISIFKKQDSKLNIEIVNFDDLSMEKSKTIESNLNEKELDFTFESKRREMQNDERKEKYVYLVFLWQSAIAFSNFDYSLEEFVRKAGYIQSAGDLIFVSSWGSLTKENILEVMRKFCKNREKSFDLYFYCKTDNENQITKLAPLLIDDKRFHIGKEPFCTAKEKIVDTYSRKITTKYSHGNGKIFVCKDMGVLINNKPLKNLYFDRNIILYAVCYLSVIKKDNPIHALDEHREAKPFWGGIFTTPHRLINAMLNIARVGHNDIIVDPFSHTGTSAIEASQFGCNITCSDIIDKHGPEDNYKFLCNGADNFLNISKKVFDLTDVKNSLLHDKLVKAAQSSYKLNEQGLPEVLPNRDMNVMIGELNELKDIHNRIFFYIARRYLMEKSRRFEPSAQGPVQFVKEYLKNPDDDSNGKGKSSSFYGYFAYGKILKAFEDEYKVSGQPKIILSNKSSNGLFEDEKFKTDRIGYINKSDSPPKFKKRDIVKDSFEKYMIDENSVAAVIADPPYGYGESLKKDQVERIYRCFLEKSFRWVRPFGFIVFCALDKVKTGRRDDLLFTEDVLKLAENIAREMDIKFIQDRICSDDNRGFSNVLYWKSKYALNRSIIVLNITKKRGNYVKKDNFNF